MKKEKQELFDYDKLFKNYLFEVGAKIDYLYRRALSKEVTCEECVMFFDKLNEEAQNDYGYDNFWEFLCFVKNDLRKIYSSLENEGVNKSIVLDYKFLEDYSFHIRLNIDSLNDKFKMYDRRYY